MNISVTNVPCGCGFLHQCEADSNSPFKYDAKMREYYLPFVSTGGAGRFIVHHCPVCGGAAPQSARGEGFEPIPDVEVRRLQGLVRTIENEGDIGSVLGEADVIDGIDGPSYQDVCSDGSQRYPLRVLTFRRLSKVADVQVMVFSNRSVETVIAPKAKNIQR